MAGQEGAQIQRAPPRRRMAGQRRIFLSGQMQQQYCRREYAEPPVGSESGAFLGPEEVGVRGAHGLVGWFHLCWNQLLIDENVNFLY